MAKPTNWKPARDDKGATRTSNKGNTVHRQDTPHGPIEHVNRKDGSSVRAPGPTTDPTHTKK